jgi:hypothetical protein
MKRSLIPKSKIDRIGLGTAFASAAIAVIAFTLGETWLMLLGIFGSVGWLFNVYVLQDQVVSNPSVDEYSRVIKNIEEIGKQLSKLGSFLEKERARISDAEATIRKLDEEKNKLEPLVNTQRETVDAILAAHSERTAKRAWKERIIGFSLGLAASLIAAVIYEYFK